MSKDNFSKQASDYAIYRPDYPNELFEFLLPLVKNKNCAWDCATGNGQVATVLADYFTNIKATDISAKQLENAIKKPNIEYSIQPAEKTNFPNQTFDLITVAQAAHWFRFDEFYKEVQRVANPGCILAIIGYGLCHTGDATDKPLQHLYSTVLQGYWDTERTYIDKEYTTLPFPFEEITAPEIEMKKNWTVDQFIGYLNTWSAVQHYIKKNGTNPVLRVENEIRKTWGEFHEKVFMFKLLLKIARMH
jgi:ubiquinone/menaquinone biosynthesis C-methylase UbiE